MINQLEKKIQMKLKKL